MGQQKQFVCTNCGNAMQELYKKFSNSVKTLHCLECHNVADKYIELEPIITLIDTMLLSEQAFRHILFNGDFKLHSKLSLVLLLLESFAMWRETRASHKELEQTQADFVHEGGFYLCCLKNILEYLVLTFQLTFMTLLLSLRTKNLRLKLHSVRKTISILLKAVVTANLSKFFLLPIMVWRQNTTEYGVSLHYLLVKGHHVCSLIFVYYVIVSERLSRKQVALVVIPLYFIKDYFNSIIAQEMQVYMR